MANHTDSIRFLRMQRQMLRPKTTAPVDQIVHDLAGVQAQDLRWTPWTVGTRSRDCTVADVVQAIENRRIVKSWLLRGTLHLVARRDLHWMTDLIAPTIIWKNTRRYTQLGLSEEHFDKAEHLLRQALLESPVLSRSQARQFFERHGLSADGQRLHYLLQRASLDGVLRHGLEVGREPRFVLRDSDMDSTPPTEERSALIRRLARRYFTGHSPATKTDFVWWSGLPAGPVSAAIAELTDENALIVEAGDCTRPLSPSPVKHRIASACWGRLTNTSSATRIGRSFSILRGQSG